MEQFERSRTFQSFIQQHNFSLNQCPPRWLKKLCFHMVFARSGADVPRTLQHNYTTLCFRSIWRPQYISHCLAVERAAASVGALRSVRAAGSKALGITTSLVLIGHSEAAMLRVQKRPCRSRLAVLPMIPKQRCPATMVLLSIAIFGIPLLVNIEDRTSGSLNEVVNFTTFFHHLPDFFTTSR